MPRGWSWIMCMSSFNSAHKRLRRKPLAIVIAMILVTAIIFVVHQWPRWVLMADVRRAESIIVRWHVRDENDTEHEYAFSLEGSTRDTFVTVLDENLGLDYTRGIATVPPTICIYLLDSDKKLQANYAIRHAQGGSFSLPHGKMGGGRCPSMELLRDIASHGRRFSESEMSKFFDHPHPPKWPGLGGFDYTLPVVPSEEESP